MIRNIVVDIPVDYSVSVYCLCGVLVTVHGPKSLGPGSRTSVGCDSDD